MTPFWIEFCFWTLAITLFVFFITLLVVAKVLAEALVQAGENHHSLKAAYEQHREANRKALQKLRKRVKGLEMVVKRGPTPVNFTDKKKDIMKWDDIASASSEGCATSKSVS